MVSVKYLGVTVTATGTNFAHVSVAVVAAFLKPLTATETCLVAPVQIAVPTRQFGSKNHQIFPQNQQKKKKKIFVKNGKICFYFLKMPK